MDREPVRLQKLIAQYGYSSRRKAENLIKAGRVRVDGRIICELGAKVPAGSTIEIDGDIINQDVQKVYLMLNKPVGYICSKKDPFNRKLIYDLLDEKLKKSGTFTIGRLDLMSEGLLLLTNDGDFAQRVGHPSGEILKKYEVTTNKNIPYKSIAAWKNGLYIKGVKYIIIDIQKVSPVKTVITLNEGKNREIRNLFHYIDLKVKRLRRVAIGPLKLGDLPIGKYRMLTHEEVMMLIKVSESQDE